MAFSDLNINMDDEFKLCWKNFQDNIASGFQNLYDRGDLVDVTLACDGKLLHAHKIVLAICSPYFQEIFITNPCKHPIIILKDVHFNIMCELLEFMYQGVVNVKHTELQSFMKIGQLLQIKGLATNSTAASTTIPEKLTSKKDNPTELETNISTNSINRSNVTNEINSFEVSSNSANNSSTPAKVAVLSPASSPLPMTNQPSKCSPDNIALQSFQPSSNLKRNSENNNDTLAMYPKKPFRRSASHADQVNDDDENDAGIEHVNPEDFFLSTIPHISMVEPRYDLSSVKREGDHSDNSAASSSMRNSFGPSFGFDYNLYKNSSCPNMGTEFSNDMHVPNDYSKNFGNHMDIPPSSSNVTMLSSTSLLHGNCVFNRNNTVATQQGMKTYWLCKSYRISMCRARCITHQGRVISATGVHNHPPHMRKSPTASGSGSYNDGSQMMSTLSTPSSNVTAVQPGVANLQSTTGGCFPNSRSSQAPLNMFQPNQSSQHPLSISPNLTTSTHLHPHPNLMIQPYSPVSLNPNVINSQAMAITNSQSSVSISSQSQDSATSNVMLNSNIVPNSALMHPPTPNSPYLRDTVAHSQSLNSSLIITPVSTESPKHIHSPSNLNKHSQFRESLIELPSNSAMPKLPLKGNFGSHEENGSSEQIREQILLSNNATVLPSDMRLSSKNFGENRNVPATSSEAESQGEAQVSRPIRISPDSGHNFKIENM